MIMMIMVVARTTAIVIFFQNITKMCLLGRPWEYVEWGQLNVSVHFESAATLYRYGV